MITIDFETLPIVGNPIVNPPEPVGVAIYVDGYPPVYYSWNPYGEQNCEKADAVAFLERCWYSHEPLLFHNAPFDVRVAEHHLGLRFPFWKFLHDTQYLVYLADPYAQTLSLKPSAERYLDLPAEEQDELYDWIVRHVPEATKKTAGAYIYKAPLYLVEKYAIGDVVRTRELYRKLYPDQPQGAYDRERELMPILIDSTRRGIRLDRPNLQIALERATSAFNGATARVRQALGAPNLNPSSGPELATALDLAGAVTHWVRTPTGEKSIAKKALQKTIGDPELLRLITYRSSLETCITTFMIPWLEMSETDGRLHPDWNQVRSTEGKRKGTRTGRLSSSNPNMQNVPTEFNDEIPAGLPDIPFMRRFLLPEEGQVWLKRDFSQQEIRIAAHFEDGPLLAAYKENPDLDPHQMAKDMIQELCAKDFPRKHVKITAFQLIYGGGVPAVSTNVGCTQAEAKELKDAYFTAMPGIRDLARLTTQVGRSGLYITTWGGRRYHKDVNPKNPHMDFSYKLMNYLIQGSAADQTKDCIIQWYWEKWPNTSFLATVHDEINISASVENAERAMIHLRKVMNEDRFDCPMRSEGFVGDNWQDITEYEP